MDVIRLHLLAQEYLLPDSPTYFGSVFDALTPVLSTFWPDNLRKALETNRPQGVFGDADGPFAPWHKDFAASFTRAMHSFSIAPALAWPDHMDLSQHKLLLDIGGGSGAHSLGALSRWLHLRATILDRDVVCDVAQEFIDQYQLAERATTHAADFFAEPFPAADLHFYGNIFHDWRLEKVQSLTRKSYESLPAGSRIIVHEMLFNKDRTGPFSAAAFNIEMLISMQGEQYSGEEIAEIFKRAGFKSIKTIPTSVTGVSLPP